MAMQGMWSGTISFSLVAIPVRLVKAIEPDRISFRLLHSKDFSPLERRMFCPEEETMVPPDEIIRGYEILPDKYIPITDEELESVSPERSRTIEIMEFIDMKEVDPVYYDRPYYLVPSRGGEKAFRLLVEVMHRTNKAGLARFVLAEREHLVAVTVRDGVLVVTTLHYSDEILPEEDLSPVMGKVEAEEQGRIKKIVGQMIEDFDPGKYADECRKRLTDLLAAKVKEKAPVEAPVAEEEEGEGPPDLVAALEESMRKAKKDR
jgi:DNA end-binding protein Ku